MHIKNYRRVCNKMVVMPSTATVKTSSYLSRFSNIYRVSTKYCCNYEEKTEFFWFENIKQNFHWGLLWVNDSCTAIKSLIFQGSNSVLLRKSRLHNPVGDLWIVCGSSETSAVLSSLGKKKQKLVSPFSREAVKLIIFKEQIVFHKLL